MHSHLIDEDAFNHLTRAHDAVRALYFLLDTYGNSEYTDGLLEAKGLSALAEHILCDMRKGIEGCELICGTHSSEI